jgi:hypothetical protein
MNPAIWQVWIQSFEIQADMYDLWGHRTTPSESVKPKFTDFPLKKNAPTQEAAGKTSPASCRINITLQRLQLSDSLRVLRHKSLPHDR